MDDRQRVIDAGAELIELITASTSIDADPLVARFREVVFTQHEFVELEVEPTWALVDTLTEQFATLAGGSSQISPLLQMDSSAFDSFEIWAQQICILVGLDDSFRWDWHLAKEHHDRGGVDPIPQGMLALDEWLTQHGFRFVGLNDDSDAYHGFAVDRDDLQRSLDLAASAQIGLYQPSTLLASELELDNLDAASIRSKKFSRRMKGYDRRDVAARLVSLADRVEQNVPTQQFHFTVSGRVDHGSAFELVRGGYDVDEVKVYLHELVTMSRRLDL